jgi:lysyl-tRNA synthetase class 2
VETPIIGRFGITDVYLTNIQAHVRGEAYALQTSPEYHMKRLLAAGSGPIYQLSRVFRDDELGRWHNPEFTLLEWYQLNIDHHGLLDEMDILLQRLLGCAPLVCYPYQVIFETLCGINPFTSDWRALRACVSRFGLAGVLASEEDDCDQYLFLLMSHVIEPALALESTPVAVFGFPVSQAALARIEGGCAARFEVYFRGVELANGFYELTDVALQMARFEQDNQIREAKGLPIVSVDTFLLQALTHGLPHCSGVALGVDRVFALAMNETNIASCLAFDFSRA